MKIFLFLSCFLILTSCTKDKAIPKDHYAWVNNYSGNFRFINNVSGHSSDLFSIAGNGSYSYSNTTENTISRITGNKILLNGWTVFINQNKEFSFSLDTSYINNSGHHISSIKNLSGKFFSEDSLKYTYSENSSNSENGTSHSESGEALGTRIK